MSLQTYKRLALFGIVILFANISTGRAEAQGRVRQNMPKVQSPQPLPPNNSGFFRPGGIAPINGLAGYLGGSANPFASLSANAYPFTPLNANAYPFVPLNSPMYSTPPYPFPDYTSGGFGYPGLPNAYPYGMASMYPPPTMPYGGGNYSSAYGGGNYSAPPMSYSMPYDNGMTQQGGNGSGGGSGNIYEPKSSSSKSKNGSDSSSAPMLLSAIGLTDETGVVRWPLAFRLLPPEKEYLRRQVETVFQLALAQSVGGRSSPVLTNEARQAVGSLRQWLTEREDGLAEATRREARAFLRKLDDALRSL